MNVRYLLVVSIVIPLFAGQMTNGVTNKNTEKESTFLAGRSDTLKYDAGTFDDGLAWFTSSGQSDPHEDSTWGTATYFILSEFGQSNPAKLVSVSLCWYGFANPEYNFRLYVWNNNGSILEPRSQGPHLYRDLNAELHDVQYEFKEFDLSAQNIALPDTFWIGVCGNHFGPDAAGSDWSLAFDKSTDDSHTYCNDMDDEIEWFPASEWSFAFAYGVRVLVEGGVGISKKQVLSYGSKAFNVSLGSKGRTDVRFSLLKDTKVTLSVYDAIGKHCKTLISGNLSAGKHNKSFNLDLVSGIYFFKFRAGYGENVTQKISIVK